MAKSMDFDPKTHLFFYLRTSIDPSRLSETFDPSYDVLAVFGGLFEPAERIRGKKR